MNDNEKYIEEFVKDIPFDTPNNEHRDNLKKELLNAFPKHRLQTTVHTVNVRRTIMKTPVELKYSENDECVLGEVFAVRVPAGIGPQK